MARVHRGIPRASHPNLLCSPLTPPPQSFYLHPSPHALASGPNLDETNGGNLDKCTDETNNYLVPEGSFFSGGVVMFIRLSLLVDCDRSARIGLYVSLSFSQRLSLREPLDLLSCKCATWAAFRQIPRLCRAVTLCLRTFLRLL